MDNTVIVSEDYPPHLVTLFSNTRSTSICLLWAAITKGALPCFFETFTLAPIFSNSRTIRGFFQLRLLKFLNILLISVTTQARCFRNSQKTSQWSLSAVANSAVK